MHVASGHRRVGDHRIEDDQEAHDDGEETNEQFRAHAESP
jgi:hypothetical protein